MILSHRHRFIFVKTLKTGGSSVEIALAAICGPDDVITDQKEYHSEYSNVSAQNTRLPQSQWSIGARLRKFAGLPVPVRGSSFYQHMRAKKIRESVPTDVWNNYFKFTIERNPWDRQVSQYHWIYRRNPNPPSFRTFMKSPLLRRKSRNWRIYTDRNKVLVDRVILYHDLENGLRAILDELGIVAAIKLPRAKSGLRKERDYRAFYDDETRSVVERIYAREIAEFGFEF